MDDEAVVGTVPYRDVVNAMILGGAGELLSD